MVTKQNPEATAKSWESSIERTRSEYNSSMEKVPAYAEYSEAEKETRQKKYMEGEKQKALIKIDGLSTNVLRDKQKLLEQKNKILYPNLSDSLDSIKTRGELQVNNALMFLNSPQPAELIVQNLNESLEQGRMDYFSTIIKKVLSQQPKDGAKDKHQAYLVNSVRKIFDEFREASGLSSVENELEAFQLLENKLQNFKMLVQSGEHYIFFPEAYKDMNPEEKKKANRFVDSLPLYTSIKMRSLMNSGA